MVEKNVTFLVLDMASFPKYHKIPKKPTIYFEKSQNTIEAYCHAF